MTHRVVTYLLAAFCLAGAARAGITDGADESILWNGFSSACSNDTLLMVTCDFGVQIQSFGNDLVHRTVLSRLPLDQPVVDARLSDSTAIAYSNSGIAYIIDVSELPEMTLLGEFDLGTLPFDLAVRDRDIYMACGFDGLRHYRLDDNFQPVLVDSSLTGVHCIEVRIEEDRLYVLDDYNGIVVYELDGDGRLLQSGTLWIPRRAITFDICADTVIVGLADRRMLYRGAITSSGPELIDSLDLVFYPEAVFAIDTLIACYSGNSGLLQVRSNSGGTDLIRYVDDYETISPRGVTLHADGSPYLILLKQSGGLAAFDLSEFGTSWDPQQGFDRPGPITSLSFYQGMLATGGEENPIEFYGIADDASATRLMTAQWYSRMTTTANIGDYIVAYFPDVIALGTAFTKSEAITVTNFLTTRTHIVERLRPIVNSTAGDGPFALSINKFYVEFLSVADNGLLSFKGKADPLDEVIDAVVADSVLLVSKANSQLDVYRVFGGLSPLLVWTISTPVNFTHLTAPLRDDNAGGLLPPHLPLAFGGHNMYEIVLQNDLYPIVVERGTTPYDVKATQFSEYRMYTAGEAGMSIFDMSQDDPQLIDYGGYGGHLLAYQDSVLAVSDGSAIHLYSLRTSGTSPAVDSTSVLDVAVSLHQNYPNPFNPKTNIAFDLKEPSPVRLEVFDILGRRVVTLLDNYLAAGPYTVEWDGKNLSGREVASGVYLYRLTTSGYSEVRKMVMMK